MAGKTHGETFLYRPRSLPPPIAAPVFRGCFLLSLKKQVASPALACELPPRFSGHSGVERMGYGLKVFEGQGEGVRRDAADAEVAEA